MPVPPDPRFNDLDGSRNDIGMYGGHNFISDGRTTDKPIVLGLDVAPDCRTHGWHRHHRIHRSHREVNFLIMKSSILTFLFSLILGTTLAHGAVIMVSPGQSVQTAINSASTGDEIVLQAGSYNEDLNITGKGLTLRAFNLPWIAKSISVFNSSTPCKFENFQLLEDLNSTGTNLEVRNANIGGSITVNQAGLKLTKSTIDNQVLVNHSVNDIRIGYGTFITQSTISQRMVCKAKKSWV